MSKEEIVKSAIRYNDEVYTGFNHAECFKQINNPQVIMANIEEGFITSKGRFVDRKKASEIALNAGQLDYHTECLISEDLHLVWLNKQDQQLAELKAENERLKEENKVGDFWHSAYKEKQAEYDLLLYDFNKAQQQLKSNTHQVCEKIREKVNKADFNKIPQKVQQAIKFSICYEIDQIEKG